MTYERMTEALALLDTTNFLLTVARNLSHSSLPQIPPHI
jgi:hypothetical protein